MDSPLHKSPIGFLELLRLRTLGRAPELVADTIRPTIDSTSFYGCDLQEVDSFNNGAAAYPITVTRQGLIAARTFSSSMTVAVGAAAGTFLRMRLGYRPNPGAALATIAYGAFVPTVAGVFTLAVLLPSPIVHRPGASWTFEAFSDAAGADHVAVTTRLFEQYSGG